MSSDRFIRCPLQRIGFTVCVRKVPFHRHALVEGSVQATPFGANTTATNPANQTRYASASQAFAPSVRQGNRTLRLRSGLPSMTFDAFLQPLLVKLSGPTGLKSYTEPGLMSPITQLCGSSRSHFVRAFKKTTAR
jgi:hypothetical protein